MCDIHTRVIYQREASQSQQTTQKKRHIRTGCVSAPRILRVWFLHRPYLHVYIICGVCLRCLACVSAFFLGGFCFFLTRAHTQTLNLYSLILSTKTHTLTHSLEAAQHSLIARTRWPNDVYLIQTQTHMLLLWPSFFLCWMCVCVSVGGIVSGHNMRVRESLAVVAAVRQTAAALACLAVWHMRIKNIYALQLLFDARTS